jgi:serine/threonine protein kinase
MKKIFENWRYAKNMFEKINYLESNRRFILDELRLIEEKDHIIPISDEEMNKIKMITELEGEANFLGTGTKGSAYKFNNKVLKFTRDVNEAMACQLIKGKTHPNVYDVYFVAKRNEADINRSEIKEPYIITYEFLDYPTRTMLEVAKSMHGRITMGKNPEFFYNWTPNTYNEAKSLLANLAKIYNKNPNIFVPDETKRAIMPREKLEQMCKNADYNALQTRLVGFFFGGPFSPPSKDELSDPKQFSEYVQNNQENIKRDYLNQLALGLSFLKQNNIDFHDIKGTNIMQKNEQICIIDIGYSKVKEYPDIPML